MFTGLPARAAFAIGVAAGASVVLAVGGLAATTRTKAFPPQLVGTWTRLITKADVRRSAGGIVFAAGHVATLTIGKTGHWKAVVPGLPFGSVDGTVAGAGTEQVHLNVSGEPPSLYRWRVSGNELTLTRLKDSMADRRLFFVGVWKRK